MLDPQIAAFLALAQASQLDPTIASMEAIRAHGRNLRLPWNCRGPSMAKSRESTIAGLRCRLHLPSVIVERQPFTLYLHGGGWTLLDIDTHDDLARRIACASQRPVLLVDYPLAPEHAFPAPLIHLRALLEALDDADLGSDLLTSDFAIAGDSAGANLAVGLATLLSRETGVQPRALALLYGSFDPSFDSASHRAYGLGSLPLTTARMRWFWDNYVPDMAQRQDPLASPLQADLAGLPPVFLGVAQLDILYDENMLFAAQLGAAGVELTLKAYPGTVHGFAEAAGAVGAAIAQRALSDLGRFITTQLSLDLEEATSLSTHESTIDA